MPETVLFALDDDQFMLDVIKETLAPIGNVHTGMIWSDISPQLIKASRSGRTPRW